MLKGHKLSNLNFNTKIIFTVRAVLLIFTFMELYSSMKVQLQTLLPLFFLFIILISERYFLGFYSELDFKKSKLFIFYTGMVFISLFLASSSPDTPYEQKLLNGKNISIIFLVLVFSNDISDYFQHKLSIPTSILSLVISLYFININSYEYSYYFYTVLIFLFLTTTYLRVAPIGDILLFSAIVIFVISLNVELVFVSIFVSLSIISFLYSKHYKQEVPLIPMVSTPLAFAYVSPNFSNILGA